MFAGGLDTGIGVMKFEWAQPMDRPPFELSTHGSGLKRLATTVAQSAAVTARIRELPPTILRPRHSR